MTLLPSNVKTREGIYRMVPNPQQRRIPIGRPGLKPAGQIIDFRKEKLVKTPQETLKITCGLCRFPFERITIPAHLVLVCPSCGIRFEHRIPESEPEPEPGPLETALETALSQNLQWSVFVEDGSEMEQPLTVGDTVEPLHAETESAQADSANPHQVFVPIASTEELDFGPAYDSQIDFGGKTQTQTPDTQENPHGAQWISSLITIAQAILIAVALIGLVNGMSSYFREKTTLTAQTTSEIPGDFHDKEFESTNPEQAAEINTESEPQLVPAILEPVKTASLESKRNVEQMDHQQDALPLFDVGDFSSSLNPQNQRSQQETVEVENPQKLPALGTEAELTSIPPVAESAQSIVQEAETGLMEQETEIDAWQQVQLQAKLAATEKQVQALLQEQEEIQTQSKKLMSETLLWESAISLEKNPARSLFLSLKSIQILQELGLQVSDWGKTILGQAYAAQSTGESFIERLPSIEAQSVSSNGKWLLTSHSDHTLWIWDLSKSREEGRESAGFQIDAGSVSVIDLLLTPDEHWLVGARADGRIELWNMTVDRPSEATVLLWEHIPWLSRVQISPDGRWLVAHGCPSHELAQSHSVQWERTVNPETVGPADWNGVWIWDMNSFKQGNIPKAVVLRGHERPVRCLAISSDSRWLATGSEDRSVRVFDLKSAFPAGHQKVLLGHQLEITDLQFALDGRWIITGSRDNTVRIWDLQSETATPTARILKGHNGWISSLAVSADGKWFATAGYDQSVRLWNVQAILAGTAEKESSLIVPEQGTVQKVAFTPDSGSLVTYGANRSLKIWNLTTESMIDHALEIQHPISSFSFGGEGRWLILSGSQGKQTFVSLWPLRFEDMIRQATRFKETALPNELQEREETYAQQFEQRMIR